MQSNLLRAALKFGRPVIRRVPVVRGLSTKMSKSHEYAK